MPLEGGRDDREEVGGELLEVVGAVALVVVEEGA
jgi:hypothetical protein